MSCHRHETTGPERQLRYYVEYFFHSSSVKPLHEVKLFGRDDLLQVIQEQTIDLARGLLVCASVECLVKPGY